MDWKSKNSGAADAEIKIPSVENTELKDSPWSRSVYSLTCYAYCQGFFPCLTVQTSYIARVYFDKFCINLMH